MKNKKEEKKTVTNLELSEQNKKLKSDLDGFKRLMILLIILMLVSVISQGLYFYAKIYKEQEETPTIETKEVEKEEEKKEELSIESQEVKSLIQTYDVFNNQGYTNFTVTISLTANTQYYLWVKDEDGNIMSQAFNINKPEF